MHDQDRLGTLHGDQLKKGGGGHTEGRGGGSGGARW
jgi:hypothetical protein